MTQQQVAATRCIADSESRNRFTIEAAIFKIRARRFAFQRAVELFDEVGLRFAVNLHQHSAPLVFTALLWRPLFGTRKCNATLFCNDPQRLRKRALLHFHYEFENVAALSAAEAEKDIPLG